MSSDLVGIDVGSSVCKCMIVDDGLRIIAQGAQTYPTVYPQAGRAEQDPEDWYRSAILAIRICLESRPGVRGLLFHPYLQGERSPYWYPHLRGDFVGIHRRHRLEDFARAVLEGVAYSLRDCFELVCAFGESITDLYLIGGGTRSRLWSQLV